MPRLSASRARCGPYLGGWSLDPRSSGLGFETAAGRRNRAVASVAPLVFALFALTPVARRRTAVSKIGRASCRESGWFSVRDGSLSAERGGLATVRSAVSAIVLELESYTE